MFCHSQGAVHIRNALIDYSPELRERIIVVAIAPGAYVYKEICASVIHYRNASLLRDWFLIYLIEMTQGEKGIQL